MRYIVNSDNYVVAISFGSDIVYADCECTEYKGNIPSGYSSLEKWYLEEELTLWRWKIIDGNLMLDPTATAPEEGQWGVPDLQSKTVSPKTTKQTVIPDEGFDGLSQVIVNAMSSGALSSPNISVSTGGVITATSKVGTSGYLSSGTSKQNTYSMSTASGNTITPGISQKTAVPKGRYTTGDVMVAGDTNLIANNIKKGVTIFGVDGDLELGQEWESVTVSRSSHPQNSRYTALYITSQLVDKHSGKLPSRILIMQQEASYEYGAAIVFADIVSSEGDYWCVTALSRDDEEYMYYYSFFDLIYVEFYSGNLLIYTTVETASTNKRAFNGTYTVSLYYDKIS